MLVHSKIRILSKNSEKCLIHWKNRKMLRYDEKVGKHCDTVKNVQIRLKSRKIVKNSKAYWKTLKKSKLQKYGDKVDK